jgi:hypothetical protein
MAQNNTLPLWYKTLHKRICYDYFPFFHSNREKN